MSWKTIGLLLVAGTAVGQTTPDLELERAKAQFEAGRYAETVAFVNKIIALNNFSDGQRIELHRLSGLSSFNLGDTKGAGESFLKLLSLNPDYVLDPFIAPPPAIRLFEQVRKDNTDQLALSRQLLQLKADQERARLEEEKKRQEAQGQRKTVVIERRPLWVNFVPFGVGQLMQDRTGLGVAFAVAEGVLAVASAVGYWELEGLKRPYTESFSNVLTPNGRFERTFWAIPPTAQRERDTWRIVKWGSGIAFFVVYAVGIVEALFHHTGDRVTESSEPRPLTHLFFVPLPGGASAGLSLTF